MDVFNKFIVTTEGVIISRVTYHKQLVWDETVVVLGGGWWIKEDENTFLLYGESEEFKRFKPEDVKRFIEEDKVYTNPIMEHSIAKKFKFKSAPYLRMETTDLN